MVLNFEAAEKLAKELQYTSFTPLQQRAFQDPAFYELEHDFFILGPTSSGKTLLPLLRYYLHLKKAQEEHQSPPKMLYIVPYRALAAQKLKEFQRFFDGEELQIAQSTGEFRQDDSRIQRGEVDIAIIIAEKVYRYTAQQTDFLAQYDLMVVDEIGLVNDAGRGGRIDFLLLWAKEQQRRSGRPGIIALGTPFYDWSEYIRSYQFHCVEDQTRPVELQECAIFYSQYGIRQIEGGEAGLPLYPTRFLLKKNVASCKYPEGFTTRCEVHPSGRCLVQQSCRQQGGENCPVSHEPCRNPVLITEKATLTGGMVSMYILTQLCRWHLSQGHQILIFQNDREQVRQLCLRLCQALGDVLPEPSANAQEEILEACGLDADDLAGIMDPAHYIAFSRGIAFHSAALPNELRSYVEENLLESRTIQIGCCTETLGFGVNSAVDVVMIASPGKPEGTGQRFLSLNEYKNYIGRAGRCRKNRAEQADKGYIYALLSAKDSTQTKLWQSFQETEPDMPRLYSHFYDTDEEDNSFLPFYLLNMLPISGEMDLDGLLALSRMLPRPPDRDEQQLREDFRSAIRFLQEEKLITASRPPRPLRPQEGPRAPAAKVYSLTELGKNLRGYITSAHDYRIIRSSLEEAIQGITLDKDGFLFHLLQTGHLENELRGAFRSAEEKLEPEMIQKYLADHWQEAPAADNEGTLRIYYIFAALLGWCEGMPTHELYRNFGVLYPLLQKVSEKAGYLIEISQKIIPTIRDEKAMQFRAKGWKFDFEEHFQAVEQQLGDFFLSVYYGINTEICRDLLTFLAAQPEPEARLLAEEYDLTKMDPGLARKLRRIAVRYRFFQRPIPVFAVEDKKARNDYKHQRTVYQRDVHAMGPYIERYFETNLRENYLDTL